MKKLSWLLVLAMLVSMFAIASAEGTYTEAPMLAAKVEAGELPPWKSVFPRIPVFSTRFWTSIWTMSAATTAAPCA